MIIFKRPGINQRGRSSRTGHYDPSWFRLGSTGWLCKKENEKVNIKQNINPNKKAGGFRFTCFFVIGSRESTQGTLRKQTCPFILTQHL